MTEVVVHGPILSSYVRTVCMTLLEKGVEFERRDVDRESPAYREMHPFGKVPTFDHGDLRLFETEAVCRYIDEAFEGPRLQPDDPVARAHMGQLIGISDSYLYPQAVVDILLPRFLVPMRGGTTDEAQVAAAVPGVRRTLGVIGRLAADAEHLTGEALSLADLHLFPLTFGLAATPEADALFADAPRLTEWTERVAGRASARATIPGVAPA